MLLFYIYSGPSLTQSSFDILFTVPPCKLSHSVYANRKLFILYWGILDAVALVVMILLNAASDRMRSRGIFVAIVFTISAVGWIILLAVTKNQHARYFACMCITIGGYAAIPLIMSWQGMYTHTYHVNRLIEQSCRSKQHWLSKPACSFTRYA